MFFLVFCIPVYKMSGSAKSLRERHRNFGGFKKSTNRLLGKLFKLDCVYVCNLCAERVGVSKGWCHLQEVLQHVQAVHARSHEEGGVAVCILEVLVHAHRLDQVPHHSHLDMVGQWVSDTDHPWACCSFLCLACVMTLIFTGCRPQKCTR